MDSAAVFQFLLSGVTTGCAYALVALGIVLAANVSGIINLAQGEYVAIGGLLVASLAAMKVPLPLCLLAVLLLGVVLGAVQERLTVGPTLRAAHFVQITVTLGVAVVIRGAAFLLYGKDPLAVPGFSGDDVFLLFGALLPMQTLWVWGGTALLLVGVFVVLSFTGIGRAIRACAINLHAARLMGINPRRMRLVVFAISGALSAITGALVAPVMLASWEAGIGIGLKGLIAAIFGGFRSPVKAVTAGISIGILESMIAGFGSSEAKDVFLYATLVIALLAIGGVFARGRDRLHLGSSH